ncbi:glucosidase family protein [Undibacterium flavidum]|uniref:Alpha-L-rhamnosidase six-hairpin glycosidase domain-containing protein n=1 Tax=Undibacterium flavidum TaxID=2762297 RepID=A0ABR6Y7D3_9BURK|nr:hypothetical protein [Undibacterium flavidum]MBC3872498.1 hypothetical protein [Undibacterium flavidum]
MRLSSQTSLAVSLLVASCFVWSTSASAQANIPTFQARWSLQNGSLAWQVKDAHTDQLEMSGRQVSAVIDYGSDAQANLVLKRTVVWPMLRTIPDDTHASLMRQFALPDSPHLSINGSDIQPEKLKRVHFDGQLRLVSELANGVQLTRLLSPAPDEPALIERLILENRSGKPLQFNFAALQKIETTTASAGTHGSYVIQANSPARQGKLKDGGITVLDVVYSARLANEMVYVDVAEQLKKRQSKLHEWRSKLVLETPEPTLNAMFDFAKIRAAESIFATRGGLLHGPGGTRYYAAIWANDQAEYANPFFPYLGDASGVESAINSFRLFAQFMNPDYRPIPSSIIAEGRGYWDGAGDRGDCAMISYGASQFALAQGDAIIAKQLSPLIDWCLEFTRRKRDAAGIIHSDSDELEGRFPAGKANLSTNVLAYGGLIGAMHLTDSTERQQTLRNEAERQRRAIDQYFSAKVGGFDTYRYYEGNDKLRAWIALPLVFGMPERQAGTVDALLSPQLWSANGLLSEAGSKTYWDRSTLYAFRGLMKMGELEKILPYFRYYSNLRLLGEHIPYAIEAWPEGNQRHLSAESALYARTITEGLFGIEPTGLRSFTMTPRLPKAWPSMALKNIRAFGVGTNVNADADDNTQQGLDIITTRNKGGKAGGQRVQVRLYGKTLFDQRWDGKQAIKIQLPE